MRRVILFVLVLIAVMLGMAIAPAPLVSEQMTIPPYFQAEIWLDDLPGYVLVGCRNRYLLDYIEIDRALYVRCDTVRAAPETSTLWLPNVSK